MAEQLERRAQREGQARTYSNADSSNAAPTPADDRFVPGSRHMPMR